MAKTKAAKIVSIANNKGGVAKTTTTQNIAAALSKSGKDVLIIDTDPQGNLTTCFGLTPTAQTYMALQNVGTTNPPILPTTAIAANFIQKTGVIDILTGGKELQNIEAQNDRNANRLTEVIQPYTEGYDYILIDTPPAKGFLTLYALFASDFVLIPTIAHYLAAQGLGSMRDTLEQMKALKGSRIKDYGVLFTMYSTRKGLNTLISKQVEAAGFSVFRATIRECIAIAEAQTMGADVFHYAPKSKGAADYKAAADELQKHLKNLQ